MDKVFLCTLLCVALIAGSVTVHPVGSRSIKIHFHIFLVNMEAWPEKSLHTTHSRATVYCFYPLAQLVSKCVKLASLNVTYGFQFLCCALQTSCCIYL